LVLHFVFLEDKKGVAAPIVDCALGIDDVERVRC